MLRNILPLLLFTSFTAAAVVHPFTLTQSQQVLTNDDLEVTAKCDCRGTNNTGNKQYICGDPRLGPVKLPRKLPLVAVVNGYDRFGGLQPGEFLKKWTAENGWWVYPPKGGYVLDTNGKTIVGNMSIRVGIEVDRFGSEYGAYLAEAEGPYDQRALPPSNLNTDPNEPDYPSNYHVYRVIKEFIVEVGPIASWFGQPGLGAQFYTGYTGNIMQLIQMGYLERVIKSKVPGGRKKGACS